MYKKLLFTLLLSWATTAQLLAADGPLWLRHQKISPDGTTIAFCYQGDIYTVPVQGGSAKQITTDTSYDGYPVWSPDGKSIAFSSNRQGSDDVYIVSRDGGVPKRLTYSSVAERPEVFLSNGTLLYSANIMPDNLTSLYPSSSFKQVYSISTGGGRPRLYSSLPMEQMSFWGENILYTDIKGYEDPWRKHHTSAITRDIWLRDKAGKYTKLTNFSGEDRNAVWDGHGGFYYLSEQDGTFNVYHRAQLNGPDTQLTHFKGNPVRFLSMANNGMLSFGYDGEMYTLQAGGKPQKVGVSILTDKVEPKDIFRQINDGASSFSVSPSGKEVALVLNGDVFVANIEYGTTKQITKTPEEERDVVFSPDGRSIAYASERNACWNIYESSLVRKEETQFAYARDIKEKQITKGVAHASFTPKYSPSGKEIAFLRNRTAIYVIELASGKERVVMPQRYNYSYSDGDQHFQWSPDGRWILTDYIGIGGWNNKDCAVFASDGSGKMVDLTESGYSDSAGTWALGGKAVVFSSDRAGYRSHGSWGSTEDLYIMFLDPEAYDDFRLSKEDKALQKEEKKQEEKAKEEKDQEEKKKKEKETPKKKDEGKKDNKKKASAKDKKKEDKKEDESIPEVPLTFENRDMRVVRLTQISGRLSEAILNKEGTKLYYIARYEQRNDLWEYNVEDRSSHVLVYNVGTGQLAMAEDGTIYVNGEELKKVAGNRANSIQFSAEQEYQPASERAYMFDHVWALIREKFYDVNLHGVDWKAYRKTYSKFLPYITEGRDFAEMLSEMLGELNASHTGASYREQLYTRSTGALGAFFDENYQGDGLKIVELLPNSPLANVDFKLKPGMIIERIDGEVIKANEPLEKYLNGKVNKRVVLTVDGREIYVKPISLGRQHELLFQRWLRQREDLVAKWSNGRIGYVYVRNMDSPSFRSVFKDLLGKYRNCDAVVVDTRHNGGGWLHEDLAILLSGKEYLRFTPRGQYIGSDPFMQWNKPSCVLMNEANYSNGHGFPWVYQHLKLGKLIGTPMAGTMTAVWWETLVDGQTVFGIPQVTCSTPDGKVLENMNLIPDIEIYNTPEDYNSGADPQLKRAVEEMLAQTKTKK